MSEVAKKLLGLIDALTDFALALPRIPANKETGESSSEEKISPQEQAVADALLQTLRTRVKMRRARVRIWSRPRTAWVSIPIPMLSMGIFVLTADTGTASDGNSEDWELIDSHIDSVSSTSEGK